MPKNEMRWQKGRKLTLAEEKAKELTDFEAFSKARTAELDRLREMKRQSRVAEIRGCV